MANSVSNYLEKLELNPGNEGIPEDFYEDMYLPALQKAANATA